MNPISRRTCSTVVIESLESRTLLATLPPGFAESQFAVGVDVPTSMEFAPDGRLFVTQKTGEVRVVGRGGRLLDQPFLSLSVNTAGERGLQSIAFDPDFADNGFVYVFYPRADRPAFNRISRFTVSASNPNVANPASELVILDNLPTPSSYHNGGFMHFGRDGMLYVGVGDGNSNVAQVQSLGSLNGKILRLNVSAYPNIIPPDNPFVGRAGARGEIYALGFRNPFSGNIDRVNGRLFVNDVGANAFEEVDRVTAGGNYGWPTAEGLSNDPRFVNPLYSYPHGDDQAAVTGGVFYRGRPFPAHYRGDYFFADYLRGWIRRYDSATGRVRSFATGAEAPLDLDIGPDGSLYYLSGFGDGFVGTNRPIMRVRFVGNTNRPPEVTASASPTAGALPLTVTFRAAGTDPDGDRLSYTWYFGDRTAAGRGQTVQHIYRRAGLFNATVVVRDGRGAVVRSNAVRIDAGNRAPVVTINQPAAGALYSSNQQFNFSGSAVDPEDGPLPASSLRWSVAFHHRNHVHTFIDSIPGVSSGSFQIPPFGETDPRQFYRVHLIATDSRGVQTDSFIDLRPRLTELTLASNIPGLSLRIDQQPQATPHVFTSVQNMSRTLTAPQRQVFDGRTYEFVSWSDGGAAEHSIRVPTESRTYTATYRAVG